MSTNHDQDTKKREEGDASHASQERASGHWKDQTYFFTFFFSLVHLLLVLVLTQTLRRARWQFCIVSVAWFLEHTLTGLLTLLINHVLTTKKAKVAAGAQGGESHRSREQDIRR